MHSGRYSEVLAGGAGLRCEERAAAARAAELPAEAQGRRLHHARNGFASREPQPQESLRFQNFRVHQRQSNGKLRKPRWICRRSSDQNVAKQIDGQSVLCEELHRHPTGGIIGDAVTERKRHRKDQK